MLVPRVLVTFRWTSLTVYKQHRVMLMNVRPEAMLPIHQYCVLLPWFLKIDPVRIVCMCMCVCVCVCLPPRLLITSGVI